MTDASSTDDPADRPYVVAPRAEWRDRTTELGAYRPVDLVVIIIETLRARGVPVPTQAPDYFVHTLVPTAATMLKQLGVRPQH